MALLMNKGLHLILICNQMYLLLQKDISSINPKKYELGSLKRLFWDQKMQSAHFYNPRSTKWHPLMEE